MPVRRSTPTIPLAAMLIAAASLPAAAAESPAGRLLASNCYQCHGTNGRGPGFDELAGKSARELYKDLKEFQSGEEGDGLMAAHARGYSDAQLKAIARYLSRQR